MKQIYQLLTRPNVLIILLPLTWGATWAAVLQWTRLGQFLAIKRTWTTVVVGVGGNMLIALIFLSINDWLTVLIIFGASSIPIIFRSLANERAELREGISDATTRQAAGE